MTNHKIALRKNLLLRTGLRLLFIVMLLLAFAGISWGTYLEPVSKNGSSVCFVFDISNSMLAKDCPNKTTRLKAAGIYAKKLLSKLNDASVSVVLAKGDGIAAIPLTQDYAMVESLIDSLSPSLMTVPGTSLGKGITKAQETFSKNYAAAGKIWVFTDGEETDSHLKNALTDCARKGIPVSIIGFGSESESVILAGDGKTEHKTALRSERILEVIEAAKKSHGFYKNQTELNYVKADEKGSASVLLSQIRSEEEQIISYEAKPVPRFKLFLLLGILFLALSYFAAEFDFTRFNVKGSSAAMLFLCVMIFTGCSSRQTKILEGSYSVSQKQYNRAISLFLQSAQAASAAGNERDLNYALYDLATSYSLLGEDKAAMEKFSRISDDAPDAVRYAAFYNAGIIASRNEDYEMAREYFKKALEVDNTRIEAKINLELSIQSSEVEVQQSESRALPSVEEESPSEDLEKAVFERIKENDKNQWKNSESNQNTDLSEDY